MADNTTSQKKKSFILPAAAGLLLVAFIGLFFLPQLLSTNWAANKVVKAVSDKAPGKVNFDGISLGWLSPIRIEGITYDDAAAGVLVKVAEVTSSKGLLALVTNYRNPGELTISDPALFINVKEKPAQAEPPSPSAQPSTQPAPKAEAPDETRPSQSGPVTFPAVTLQLNVTGGRVIARRPASQEKQLVKGLELSLMVNGPDNHLEYLVDFQSGDDTGKVHGKGTLTLAPENPVNLDTAESQATLDISSWEIGDLLAILANSGNLPEGSGQINGQVKIAGSGESGLTFTGNLSARQIKLYGGPLTSDTPSLDRVNVVLDGVKTGSTLTINTLALDSPLAKGTASVTLGTGGQKEVTSTMTFDLASLFTQFPATLKLKEGLAVSSGKLHLDASADGTPAATSFAASARLDGLEGMAGAKKIFLDKPVTVQARGEQNAKGLRLDNFTVQSSFANGQGQGDMNTMQLTLAADLGGALKEIEKFIQVDDWKSAGKMNLNLQVDTKKDNLRTLSAEVTVTDFVLQQASRVIAPRGGLKAKLVTDLSLDDQLRPKEMTDTALDIQSWLGTTSLRAKQLVPPTDIQSVQLESLEIQSGVKLEQLAVLLHSIEKLPGDTGIAGSMDINSRISLHENQLQLSDVKIDVSDLLLQIEAKKLREKNFRVTTRGVADLKAKKATLKPLQIATSAGDMVFPEMAITDWNNPARGVKTGGTVKLDLDLLTKLLGDFIELPGKTSVAGLAEVEINVDLTSARQQSIQLEAHGSNLKVISENKPPITEDALRLAVDLNGDLDAQNFTLEKLEFSSVPVSLSARGQVTPNGTEHRFTSDGSISMNLQAVSSYLKSLGGLEIEMTGTDSSPFRIVANSSNGKWADLPRTTTFSTSFRADTIRGFGMLIEALDLPVELADSLGKIEIVGAVNKGTMALKPTIDFSGKPAIVSLPENSTLLSAVGLTEGMSKDLLVHIHPIFKDAAVSRGTVDLAMENFRWPLDEKARNDATFSGSLTFNGVKLQAGGLLAPLLDVMKVKDREIILSEQPMTFVGENGRVRCSPLEASVNEYTLKLSGSIGFDQSLDYLAQIPVTRKMVSGDVYQYLEGTYISVPIGGTVANPSISRNVVQAALKDLVLQAGTKQLSDQAGKLLQKLFQ